MKRETMKRFREQREHVQKIETEMQTSKLRMDEKMDQLKLRMDEKMDQLKLRMDEKMDQLKLRMDEKMDQLIKVVTHQNSVSHSMCDMVRVAVSTRNAEEL